MNCRVYILGLLAGLTMAAGARGQQLRLATSAAETEGVQSFRWMMPAPLPPVAIPSTQPGAAGGAVVMTAGAVPERPAPVRRFVPSLSDNSAGLSIALPDAPLVPPARSATGCGLMASTQPDEDALALDGLLGSQDWIQKPTVGGAVGLGQPDAAEVFLELGASCSVFRSHLLPMPVGKMAGSVALSEPGLDRTRFLPGDPRPGPAALSAGEAPPAPADEPMLCELLQNSGAEGQQAIPPMLRERMRDAMMAAGSNAEMGFALAVSLCERWNSPAQTEFIFGNVLRLCQAQARNRNIEMTLSLFRAFAQMLPNDELRRRAQLRIGRVYYEHGEYGKAVMELTVDIRLREVSPVDTLAGLVKAFSLIRLKRSEEAIELLEWVARSGQSTLQQARAGLLLGKLYLLRQRGDDARRWLTFIATELGDNPHLAEAQKLLARMDRTEITQ